VIDFVIFSCVFIFFVYNHFTFFKNAYFAISRVTYLVFTYWVYYITSLFSPVHDSPIFHPGHQKTGPSSSAVVSSSSIMLLYHRPQLIIIIHKGPRSDAHAARRRQVVCIFTILFVSSQREHEVTVGGGATVVRCSSRLPNSIVYRTNRLLVIHIHPLYSTHARIKK